MNLNDEKHTLSFFDCLLRAVGNHISTYTYGKYFIDVPSIEMSLTSVVTGDKITINIL